MARVLVLYASRDKRYAEEFARAVQRNRPDIAFDLRDNTAAFAFDLAALPYYGDIIALLSPEAFDSSTMSRVLSGYSQMDGAAVIAVMLRPVTLPTYLAQTQSINAETLSPQQLADRLSASLGEPIAQGVDQAAEQRGDEQIPSENEPSAGFPPPPPAPPTGETAAPSDFDWPAVEEERGAPPPPPPAPKPEPPAAQPAPPPYYPPAPEVPGGPPSAPGGLPPSYGYDQPAQPPSAPPPAPGALPPGEGYGQPAPTTGGPSPHLGEVGGAASDRPRDGGRFRLTETLQFSAYHPNESPVESWQTLLVYSHLATQLAQVQADAGTFTELGSAPTMTQGQSLRQVARNVELTIEPHVEGVTFSPPQESFIWRGEWHRSLFRYSGAPQLAGTVQRGWIDIYADHIAPICTLDVSFSFHAGTPHVALSVPSGMTVTANAFDTVFISYSHRDREPMRQARETYEKMGITAYHDDLLAAGANYERDLATMIRTANVFHLLWSADAARSPEVRKEWVLALACQKGEKFIRPWYWQQPIIPPPQELQALKISFRYEHLRRRLLQPSTWF